MPQSRRTDKVNVQEGEGAVSSSEVKVRDASEGTLQQISL